MTTEITAERNSFKSGRDSDLKKNKQTRQQKKPHLFYYLQRDVKTLTVRFHSIV